MQWFMIKAKLRNRLNKHQKRALEGKEEMTEEMFWSCLDVFFNRYEMERFWELWHKYPEYVNAHDERFERDMADPNSKLRKEHDAWWANMKPKLIEYFGEDWVKEHCKDDV